jgi:hypothetical protein
MVTTDNSIDQLFAEASNADESKWGFLTDEERLTQRRITGVKRFKKAALGRSGIEITVSSEELSRLLYRAGVISSIEEVDEVIPVLESSRSGVCYTDFGSCARVSFTKVSGPNGEIAYRIHDHRKEGTGT